MTPTQPIQFLLRQLATNKENRERFNLLNQNIEVVLNTETDELLFEIWVSGFFNDYHDTLTVEAILQNSPDIITEKIIRTCLSGVDGKAVLGVFELENLFPIIYGEGDGRNLKDGTKVFVKQKGLVYEAVDGWGWDNNGWDGFRWDLIKSTPLDNCYESFDKPLRNGYFLDTALEALHTKMLELEFGYQEFLNDNK